MAPRWLQLSQALRVGTSLLSVHPTCPELWAQGTVHLRPVPSGALGSPHVCWALGARGPCPGAEPVIPQRCWPARGTLQAMSERVETQPLLRLSLAVLTIGSLLSIAIVNLVGSGGGWGRRALARSPPACVGFLGGAESQSLTWAPSGSRIPVSCLRAASGVALRRALWAGSVRLWRPAWPPSLAFHTRTWGP